MNTKQKKTESLPVHVTEIVALHEAKHRSNTRGVNHALLHQLDHFYGKGLSISDVTEEFCISFAEYLMSHVAKNSARTYLHKLHAILEHAVTAHIICKNPMPPIRTLVSGVRSPQRVYLTRDDITALTSTPCRHAETKRAFLFACQTGLRLSDIETLSWSDIIDINGKPTIVKEQVKTGREVCIPLNAVAIKLLGPRTVDGKVFSLLSRSVIASDLTAWAKSACVDKHITFHVSRHTFATLSISAGVDIYVVSRLCGHTTVRTTEIYAHIIDRTLLRGVTLLENAMMENRAAAVKKIKRMGIKDRIKKSILPFFTRRKQCPLYDDDIFVYQ